MVEFDYTSGDGKFMLIFKYGMPMTMSEMEFDHTLQF